MMHCFLVLYTPEIPSRCVQLGNIVAGTCYDQFSINHINYLVATADEPQILPIAIEDNLIWPAVSDLHFVHDFKGAAR